MEKNDFTAQVLMVGGRRCGKTSILAAMKDNWIYRCAESACPVFWKSPVRKEGITVPDKIMNAAETPS